MFSTEHYKLASKKIKGPVTIVLLADLHNHLYGENNGRLIGEIRRLHPDFICIAGDMLIGHPHISHEVAQKCVLELAKDYEIFYAPGNHESRMKESRETYHSKYEDYMEPIRSAGVHVLENQKISWHVGPTELTIYGYELPEKYFERLNRHPFSAKQVEAVLGKIPDDESFSLLLAHNPVYFREYAAWGADLTLSGHLHGGIIRLPLIGGLITPQVQFFPKYCAGAYRWQGKSLIVSRGLGTHTVPIRFYNKPELAVIHLEPGI